MASRTPPHLVAAIPCVLILVGFAIPAQAGDNFPTSFEECKERGGDVKRDEDQLVCTFGLIYKHRGSKPPGWEACLEDNTELSIDGFKRAKSACSEKFTKDLPPLSATLPHGQAARYEKLVEIFEDPDSHWHPEEVAAFVAESNAMLSVVAARLEASSQESRRRALALTQELFANGHFPPALIRVLERIVTNGAEDGGRRLRADALHLLEEVDAHEPDRLTLERKELVEQAVRLVEEDDPDSQQAGLKLLLKWEARGEVSRFVRLLDSPSPRVRQTAWVGVGAFGNEAVLEQIKQQFPNLPPADEKTVQALKDLAEDPPAAYCPLLAEEMSDEHRALLARAVADGLQMVPVERQNASTAAETCKQAGHPLPEDN